MQICSISGPFTQSLDRANAVDFSRPFYSSFYTVVIPLEIKSKMWYVIDTFDYNVWLLFITSIPIYLIAMGLTDYFYFGVIDLDDLYGFVITCGEAYRSRRAFYSSSCPSSPKPQNIKKTQKTVDSLGKS